MAAGTEHLILLSAIPVIYPKLGVLESLLKAFEGASTRTEAVLFKTGVPLLPSCDTAVERCHMFRRRPSWSSRKHIQPHPGCAVNSSWRMSAGAWLYAIFTQVQYHGRAQAASVGAGLYDKIYNHFGEPDLLDDVTDHWSSGVHEAEKAGLLTSMREIAQEEGARVTIISGDVHLAALTFLRSLGPAGRVPGSDPGFMPQIVTSGIGNKPPADFVVKYVESCGRKPRTVAPGLQENLGTLFSEIETETGSTSFNTRMNYVELCASAKGLRVQFVFLHGDRVHGNEVGDMVDTVVPPLVAVAAAGAAVSMKGAALPPSRIRKFLCCAAK